MVNPRPAIVAALAIAAAALLSLLTTDAAGADIRGAAKAPDGVGVGVAALSGRSDRRG